MLAIDDSESMRENGAGRMALEAMTVISRALVQLEVGELAIVSFGDDIKLVHPFDKPFSGESGAWVLSQFGFRQKQTRWPAFLEGALQILNHSRAMASQQVSDSMQLVFVISDARVQQDRAFLGRISSSPLRDGAACSDVACGAAVVRLPPGELSAPADSL